MTIFNGDILCYDDHFCLCLNNKKLNSAPIRVNIPSFHRKERELTCVLLHNLQWIVCKIFILVSTQKWLLFGSNSKRITIIIFLLDTEVIYVVVAVNLDQIIIRNITPTGTFLQRKSLLYQMKLLVFFEFSCAITLAIYFVYYILLLLVLLWE